MKLLAKQLKQMLAKQLKQSCTESGVEIQTFLVQQMELGFNKVYRMSFGYIDSTTI